MNGMIGCLSTDHYMYKMIVERRKAVAKGWQFFVRQSSPFRIEEIIERNKTELPDDFVPWAPGIIIPSGYLLRAANYAPGSHRPKGWSRKCPGVFTKVMYGNCMAVRQCGRFWTVERQNDEVLAFTYGSLPVFTRTYQAAMRLAEYCHLPIPKEASWHPRPRGVASSLRWVISTPDGIRWC